MAGQLKGETAWAIWADGMPWHGMERPRPTGGAGIPGRLVIPPEDREMEVEVGEVYR